MSLFRTLFPPDSRSFPGKRAVRIGLRMLHLVGTAGLGGGFLYEAPREAWIPYLILTTATGTALLLIDVWSNAVWLVQLRGVAILAKLGALGALQASPTWAAEALMLCVVMSGLIAHAPAKVRYWSVLHLRRVDAL